MPGEIIVIVFKELTKLSWLDKLQNARNLIDLSSHEFGVSSELDLIKSNWASSFKYFLANFSIIIKPIKFAMLFHQGINFVQNGITNKTLYQIVWKLNHKKL